MKQRAKFLEKMKETLKAKRDELAEHLEKVLKERGPTGIVKDSADEASSSLLNRLQSSLQESEISEIKLVEDAIDRFDRGEYGICVDCGEPISAKRLEIYSHAARCISCQEKREG